jgi:hypothetical protein
MSRIHHIPTKAQGRQGASVQKRAPRAEGPRTTLRVPDELAASADRLGEELGISRNDALLRLATRGARIYELEESIAARRAERWAAVVPGDIDLEAVDFPTPDEARVAILARDGEDDASASA